MAAPLHAFGLDVVAASPYVATLTPLPDGTWRVQRAGFPQFGFTTKKGLTYSVHFLSPGSVSIFDPKIEAFSHQDNQLAGNKTSVTSAQGNQHTELNRRRQAGHRRCRTGTRRRHVHLQAGGQGDPLPGRTPIPFLKATRRRWAIISLSMASALSEATASHERVSSLLDLWAFLVAHPSRDQLVAEQPKFKSLMLAMIPYVTAFAGHTDGQSVSADFGQGSSAKIGSLGEAIAYDSASTTEGLSLSLKVADLDVTTTSLPPWIVSALPRKVDLNLATSPLDLGNAMRVLVDKADVAKDDPLPPDALASAVAALTPNGGPTLAIKPSTLANGTLSLALLGAFSSAGSGKARIEAKGLDQEISLIAGATSNDPMAGAGSPDPRCRQSPGGSAGRRPPPVGNRQRRERAYDQRQAAAVGGRAAYLLAGGCVFLLASWWPTAQPARAPILP